MLDREICRNDPAFPTMRDAEPAEVAGAPRPGRTAIVLQADRRASRYRSPMRSTRRRSGNSEGARQSVMARPLRCVGRDPRRRPGRVVIAIARQERNAVGDAPVVAGRLSRTSRAPRRRRSVPARPSPGGACRLRRSRRATTRCGCPGKRQRGWFRRRSSGRGLEVSDDQASSSVRHIFRRRAWRWSVPANRARRPGIVRRASLVPPQGAARHRQRWGGHPGGRHVVRRDGHEDG